MGQLKQRDRVRTIADSSRAPIKNAVIRVRVTRVERTREKERERERKVALQRLADLSRDAIALARINISMLPIIGLWVTDARRGYSL